MFYPAKKDSTKDSKRIEFPKNCSGTSNNLMVPPPISEMQHIQNNMDNLLYRTNLGEDQKAKQYMQLQNKFLNCKHQLKSLIPEATIPTQPQESNQISTNVLTGDAATAPNPVQEPPEIMRRLQFKHHPKWQLHKPYYIYHGNLFLHLTSLPPSSNFDTPSHSGIIATS